MDRRDDVHLRSPRERPIHGVQNPVLFQNSAEGLELTPFGGHLISLETGVHYGKNASTVSGGVPPANLLSALALSLG